MYGIQTVMQHFIDIVVKALEIHTKFTCKAYIGLINSRIEQGSIKAFFTVLKKIIYKPIKLLFLNAIKIIEMISIRIHANINNKFSK